MTATQDDAGCRLHASIQDPKSGSADVPAAPGVVSMSQRTVYCALVGSVYVVPFAAGHCGPCGVGLDDEDEDIVVVDCIDIVILIAPEDADEEEPAAKDGAASEELEVVDCPDTKIPAT